MLVPQGTTWHKGPQPCYPETAAAIPKGPGQGEMLAEASRWPVQAPFHMEGHQLDSLGGGRTSVPKQSCLSWLLQVQGQCGSRSPTQGSRAFPLTPSRGSPIPQGKEQLPGIPQHCPEGPWGKKALRGTLARLSVLGPHLDRQLLRAVANGDRAS